MAEGGSGLPPVPEESIVVDDSGVVCALTEQHVMEAAVERNWRRVKEAMVGRPQQRVALSPDAQDFVLQGAMKKDAWGVIADLVIHGFRFAPGTLDDVLKGALAKNQLGFMQQMVMSDNPYQYDPNVLISVLGALCSDDAWLPQAFALARKLPQNLNGLLLDKVVYLPLMGRDSEHVVQKNKILNLLRNRFQPLKGDDDSD